MDDDSVTLLLGFGIRDVDASEIHPFEVLITVTHGEVIIGDTNGYAEIFTDCCLLYLCQRWERWSSFDSTDNVDNPRTNLLLLRYKSVTLMSKE
jgi:hypothetical protein